MTPKCPEISQFPSASRERHITGERHKMTILLRFTREPEGGIMRRRRTLPKYLTTEEIEAFFSEITDVRDRAIFRVAYHRRGLRASEVGLLRLTDYRAQPGRLHVRRLKGSNSGEFLLTDIENTAIAACIEERGNIPGPLLPSRNRVPISRNRLDQLMKDYCQMAGIPAEKAHCHALKHSCGTHLSEMGKDVAIIRDWLGHRNVQNTMIYLEVTNKARDAAAQSLRGWGKKAA
jgi:integrase/recombinase XerD